MASEPPVVPPVEEQPDDSDMNGRSDYEFRLLQADAKSRENLNREADQRYWLRWAVVILAVLVIVGMGALLVHVAHWLPKDTNAMGAVIALHVAPIISMTTLAIALLVAAFRGFKDGDEKSSVDAANSSVKAANLLS
ncbi:MAG: hypothetical protein WA793_03335 [Sphingorhabdus sp.]